MTEFENGPSAEGRSENNPPEKNLPIAPGTHRLKGMALLPVGACHSFAFIRKGYEVEGFILHHEQGWYAYLNQCQHWPIPLDYGDGDFYDSRIDRIRCKSHGAVYSPQTGECDGGPCIRAHLVSYRTRVVGEDIVVDLTEA